MLILNVPFNEKDEVKKLKIFKIPLKTDIIIQSNIVYDS